MTKYILIKEGSTTEPGPVLSDFAQAVVAAPDAETARGTLGVGSAGEQDASAFATAAQGVLAASAIQPSDLVTVTQAEAEAGTETERRAWTALRVKQAIVAWITANLATAWAQRFTALSGKATPVDADELGLVDSADSGNPKKLTWANIKATLKAYFDALYVAQADLATVSQAEAEAGIETTRRAWTSERVKQAIVAWITANLATAWAQRFTALSGKATPVDADELGLIDSAASGAPKKLTWASLKAALNTYFGTIYKTIAAADAQDALHRADVAAKVITREVELGAAAGSGQPRMAGVASGGATVVDAGGVELMGLNNDGSWRLRLALSVANRLFQEQISAASATAIFQSLGLDQELTTEILSAGEVLVGASGRWIEIEGRQVLVTEDGLALMSINADGSLQAKASDWPVGKLILGQSGSGRAAVAPTPAGEVLVATGDGMVALGMDGHKLDFHPGEATITRLMAGLGLGSTPVADRAIFCIGDSLTNGTGSGGDGYRYPQQLAAITGRPVDYLAKGGFVPEQIGAIWGSERIHLTVSGGSIPASGGVAVTSDVDILVNGGDWQVTYTARGYLAGIEGILSTDVSGNYTFTRLAAGSAVAVDDTNNRFTLSATGTAFIPGLGAHYDETLIIGAGRNGLKGTAAQREAMRDAVRNMIQVLSARYPSAYVLAVPNSNAEPAGDSAYDDVMALNELYRAAFGPRFIDWRTYLVRYGLYDAGVTPTAQDLTDMGNDVVPDSFRSDGTHLNDLGYEWKARFIASIIR